MDGWRIAKVKIEKLPVATPQAKPAAEVRTG
jgi:hypothetical protein